MPDIVNYDDNDYDLVDVLDNSSVVQEQSDQVYAAHDERSLGSNGTKSMKYIGYNQNFELNSAICLRRKRKWLKSTSLRPFL